MGSPPLVRERRIFRFNVDVAQGSPPLVRERRDMKASIGDYIRITPARAGKTFADFLDDFTKEDHPRSCGKDAIQTYLCWLHAGSPPLVRERRILLLYPRVRARITPARAGKTVNSRIASAS